ncbi:hypothetical protein [Thioclava sp. F28-4]|uniref:hypothetical protein n=1 Tax=Thioclava sp. F28-4 TaxID=1915315 RepID=UPI000996C833|nr:hypothetical protein [Thioclava sp. F28-4]OOY02668.1 hypothetical protein BMI87_21755 [Thioclava sp. F28-4]
MTKTIKKPSYLGTASQVAYKEALAAVEGTYASRHAKARHAVGASIVGQRVALVRIAGVEHIVGVHDIPALPARVKPHAFCIIEFCDENGAVFVRSV